MILVTGATGTTGRHLVARLIERGAAFRTLVRDEARGRALGADHVVGDFDDPASLAAAMDGIDRVFLASPGAQAVAGEQPMVRWERNVIDAARDAGVRYVVKLSTLNAGVGRPMSEGGHGAIEEHLKSSGLEWTMLQAGPFMQNFLTPTASLSDEHGNLVGPAGQAPAAFVDAHDIAASAAALLTGEPHHGRSYVITGPEAIGYRQVAAKLSKGRGEPVGFVGESGETLVRRLRGYGLPDAAAEGLASLYDAMGAGAYGQVSDAVERLTGTAPRDFDAFMAANTKSFGALT
jgi:uncharacterized protein YbjT (DUF2867 family)